MGYIIHPNHTKESIDYVDMRLWEHGENGKIPSEVVFNFTAGLFYFTVLLLLVV